MRGSGHAARFVQIRPNAVRRPRAGCSPVREVRSAALDLEQSDAEMILEAGDGVTDGRLGAVELFGRRRETAQLDNGLQDLPFIESGLHVDKYIYQIDMVAAKMRLFRIWPISVTRQTFLGRGCNATETPQSFLTTEKLATQCVWLSISENRQCTHRGVENLIRIYRAEARRDNSNKSL